MTWQAGAAGVAGLVVGWLVWLAAEHFVAHYRVDTLDAKPLDAREFPLLAAATLAFMMLWGAYVGWQASELTVVVAALVVTALLLCISLVDFQVRRIPNPLVASLLVWAAVQLAWLQQPGLPAALIGLLIGGGLFLTLRFASRGTMGMGDVKLEAALGALLGFPVILSAILLGVIAGGIAAALLLITRRAGRKDPIAYGPYLALGAWLVLLQTWGLWPG
ncbi:MAG: A24 family peptidase [Chloroflexota bacterium]|nr:A24 family peptidase [Chloroflexota bacterium]